MQRHVREGVFSIGMTETEIQREFEEAGALLSGHFLLSSGMHSSRYCEKFAVLQQPQLTERLCRELAKLFRDASIEVVVGPLTGGMLISHEVGKALGTRSLFTEREGEEMTFRRGFSLRPGERVLVVDDVLTTGRSVREVLDAVKREQAELVGVGVLVDRSGGTVDFGVRTEALLHLDARAESYAADACPLCRDGVPFTARGSRYVASK